MPHRIGPVRQLCDSASEMKTKVGIKADTRKVSEAYG